MLTEGKIHRSLVFQGMYISIEVPAGGVRTGTNRDGEKWERTLKSSYGYIKGTNSPDGEKLDCWLKRNPYQKCDIYVVHQMTMDGKQFDEDKVMLGFKSADEAEAAYKAEMHKPEQQFGGMSVFQLDHFKVMAYQASKSKAMLAPEKTYLEFKKKGLLPRGVKSPVEVAQRVSESLKYGLQNIAAAMIEESTSFDTDAYVLFASDDASIAAYQFARANGFKPKHSFSLLEFESFAMLDDFLIKMSINDVQEELFGDRGMNSKKRNIERLRALKIAQ